MNAIEQFALVASPSVYRLMRDQGYGASVALDAARADRSGNYRIEVGPDVDYQVEDECGRTVHDPGFSKWGKLEIRKLDAYEWQALYFSVSKRCQCCNAFSPLEDGAVYGFVVDSYRGDDEVKAEAYAVVACDYREGGSHG